VVRNKTTLTTGEAAAYCGVNFRTVIRWIEKGRLKAYKLPGRGDNRIQVSDFIDFLTENELPIPQELAAKSDNGTKKVLVIDDDVAMSKGIKRTLRSDQLEVTVINNSFEAGALLVSLAPSLVTLDLSMPGVDGFKVLEYIEKNCSPRPIVVVISALPKPDLDKALELGANHVHSKPFKPELLRDSVQQLLDLPSL